MEFALAIRRLLGHRVLLVTGVLVAALVGILSTYHISTSGLTPRGGVHHSTASTEILVDAPSSAIANTAEPSTTLLSIAQTIANFAPNPEVLDLIGHHAGLQGSQLYAEGPTNLDLPRVIQEPTDMQRNVQIDHETVPYRIEFNQNPNIPTIGIDAQAPTTAGAIALANATVAGLRDYISGLQSSGQVTAGHRVVLRQLGAATGSADAPSAAKALAVLAFLGVFVLWCVLLLAGGRIRDTWRRSGEMMRHSSRRNGYRPLPAGMTAATAQVDEDAPVVFDEADRRDVVGVAGVKRGSGVERGSGVQRGSGVERGSGAERVAGGAETAAAADAARSDKKKRRPPVKAPGGAKRPGTLTATPAAELSESR